MTAIGCVAIICAALLAGLWLTLRFLAEHHITASQCDDLLARINALSSAVDNEKQRLTQLSNRVR